MSTIETTPCTTLGNVVADVVVELGRREMTLGEVRRLQAEDVVELNKLAGEAFNVLVNQRLFGEGEVVVVADVMAVRITRLHDFPANDEVTS
jgi:flagellar motor switch protein FliN/FliY